MVFGPKKLPELGKGLGDGIRSSKDSVKNNEESVAKLDLRDEEFLWQQQSSP
jgi:Sec-independent protein translocase protein TatA